jgi:hypothetical protein
MTEPTLEKALAGIEADLDGALSAAAALTRDLRKARAASATGSVRDLERTLESAVHLAGALVDTVRTLRSGWRFDVRAHLESGGYAAELVEAGRARGLPLVEQDGRLVSYPSLLRVLAADLAIEIDRKRDRRLRPSILVEQLRARQARPVRFRPEHFLEALQRAYRLVLAERGKATGSVVPLGEVYGVLTLLPGQSREYSKPEFVRDVYLLDRSGIDQTRDGSTVSFPAATGTKGSGVLIAVTAEGATKPYYGIAFRP